MTRNAAPCLETSATLDALPYHSLRDHALAHARAQELAVLQNEAQGLCIETAYGLCRFAPEGAGARVTLRAPRRDWLQVLRDALVGQIGAVAPEAAARIRWSHCEPVGMRPANMHVGTVLRIEALGATFLRVRLTLDDLTAFDDRALHFRLLLPPTGQPDPEWPRVGPNGATVWPKGEKALHCPVYTARAVDPGRGELVFDLYAHEGGRGTAWARAAQPGDAVALMGPGGGGIPDASMPVLLYGDETAYPAIARILETLPAGTPGHATLLARTGAARSYPMPEGRNLRVNWLEGAPGDALAARAVAEKDGFGDHFLWFASDKITTDTVRQQVRGTPRMTRGKYIAAYW